MICSIIKSALNNVKPYEMVEEKELHTICYNVSFYFYVIILRSLLKSTQVP